MIILKYSKGELTFDDTKELYNFLLRLNNETVEIEVLAYYKIEDMVVNRLTLDQIANNIQNCITCDKEQCDCQKPYFLILNRFRSKCNICDKSKVCNPLRCRKYLNKIKTDKPSITYSSSVVINTYH